jgi:cell division protein YceG involved in septum cleavage
MAKEKMILEAYCLKLKKKEIMHNAEIFMTPKGGYIAKGTTKDGKYKLSLIMSKENALKAIENGVATKGF